MESKKIINSISKIYSTYFIPLNLQRHMMLTAGVAEQICANYKKPIDAQNIIAAALIHDLGNLVKMDLKDKKKILLLDPTDRDRVDILIEKQKEFWEKYGKNDFLANALIAKELGANKRVIFLMENKGIENDFRQLWRKDLGLAIFAYADLRVAPYGVTSMQERLEEFQKRYNLHKSKVTLAQSKKFMVFAKELEEEIFENVSIRPQDITSASIMPYIKKWSSD